ncbi:MAG TPA: TRAP transporter small permease subunit [Burkholderiaceae bacterium]|jgi:TRAP-type mannitol/chloroaromatic compound transport system permease small subunit
MQKNRPSWLLRCLRQLDSVLIRITSVTTILIIPFALLLCLQWPLREWVHAFSTQANDLAQLLFGIYVSVGITYATRMHAHLTPDVVARRYPGRVRSLLLKYVSIVIVLPWTVFILYASAPMAWQSIKQLEDFPDTFNPGYFILKISVFLFALLVLLQAVVDIFLPTASSPPAGDH